MNTNVETFAQSAKNVCFTGHSKHRVKFYETVVCSGLKVVAKKVECKVIIVLN